MSSIKIPYSRETITLDIPDENLGGILESKAHNFKVSESQETIVKNALENPVDSPPFLKKL